MVALFNILKAVFVRCFLCLHVLLCIWRVTENYQNKLYWYLALGLIPFFGEALFTIIKRQGDEFLRFSPCFFLYLATVLPGIWLLELDKSDRYIHGTISSLDQADNNTEEDPIQVPGLNPGMWIIIIEEFMPYVIIISRWLLPRGRVTREQLSELLFAYIGIAADIMEFFSLFGEKVVRGDKAMNYCVLSIWSWAVLQFTMTLTVVHQPKRAKKIKVIVEAETEDEERQKIRSEVFAIFLSMFMQDLPFVVMRLYTIITYDLLTYSLMFFTVKNLLIIALLLYKVAVLCSKRYCPQPEKRDADVEVVEGGDFDTADGRRGYGSMELSDISGKKDPSTYYNVSEDGVKKRSIQSSKGKDDNGNATPRSNGRANDLRDSPAASPAVMPTGDPGRASEPASSRGSLPRSKASTPALSKKSAKESPAPSRTSQPNLPDTGVNDGDLNRNESDVFGWINDERVNSMASEPTDGVEERDGSVQSIKSDSTTTSPLPSLKRESVARVPSPPPSPEPVVRDSNVPRARRTPGHSVSSQDTVISNIDQKAKPGDPDFKPYVSVLKLN